MTNERRAAAAFPYGCTELNPPARTGRERRDTWQLPSCELCVVSGRERPETERHLSPLTTCDRNSSIQIIIHFMDLSDPKICFKCAVALIHIQYRLSSLTSSSQDDFELWLTYLFMLFARFPPSCFLLQSFLLLKTRERKKRNDLINRCSGTYTWSRRNLINMSHSKGSKWLHRLGEKKAQFNFSALHFFRRENE